MKIELNKKLAEHFKRVEDLANEAADDGDERYSSRAAAMSAVTTMLKELTKAQEAIYNMERLMRIEKVAVETINKFLTAPQKEEFLKELEEILDESE